MQGAFYHYCQVCESHRDILDICLRVTVCCPWNGSKCPGLLWSFRSRYRSTLARVHSVVMSEGPISFYYLLVYRSERVKQMLFGAQVTNSLHLLLLMSSLVLFPQTFTCLFTVGTFPWVTEFKLYKHECSQFLRLESSWAGPSFASFCIHGAVILGRASMSSCCLFYNIVQCQD